MTSRTRIPAPGTDVIHSGELPEKLAALETSIDLEDGQGARREARRLLDHADPATSEKLADLVTAAEEDTANAYVPPRPAEPRHVPASPVAREWAPMYARGRRRRQVPSREARAATTSYMTERLGVADYDPDRPRAPRPVGYEIDYDKAALAPARGHACLNCHLERSDRDRRNPDGLCEECRENGHTRASVIGQRCEGLAARAGDNALAMLREGWQRANPGDKVIIAAWVEANAARHGWPQPTR